MQPRWERYANERYLDGLGALRLSDDASRASTRSTGSAAADRVRARGRSAATSRRTSSSTACAGASSRPRSRSATARSGVPARAGHLPRRRRPRPDAHRPAFAETLVRFGECAAAAAHRAPAIARRPAERLRRLTSNIRAMSRFFWFTVEFGLMRGGTGARLKRLRQRPAQSSFGEIAHAIDAPEVQRYPFQIEWVVNQALRDRPLPAAAVHRRFVRPPLRLVDTSSSG